MEEKSELNNIVLDDEQEAKIKKTKKVVLLAAAAVLLFLIIILLIFAFNKSDDNTQFEPEDQLRQNLTPAEVADKEIDALKGDALSEKKFEQVPIQESPTSGEDDKFEQIVKEIKSKQQLAPPPPPPASTEVLESTVPKVEEVQAKKEEPKSAPTPTTTTTAPLVEQKPAIKDLVGGSDGDADEVVTSIPGGYYIQVGSFVRFSPNDKFLASLKENELNYKILKSKSGEQDILRVLVGPYTKRDDALKPLGLIREKINKDAFIKRQ